MTDSILETIKNAVEVSLDDTVFDEEIKLHINTAFMTLRQLGVGPNTPFIVIDDTTTWNSFTKDDTILPMVKSYVSLKVRSLFDPPTSSSLETALKETIAEYEWRLNVETDKYDVEEDGRYGI